MKPRKLFTSKLFFILIAVIAAATLLISGSIALAQTVTPATPHAASPQATPPTSPVVPADQLTYGKVASVAPDGTSFVIESEAQAQTTIMVNQDTRYSKITLSRMSISAIMDMLEAMMMLNGAPGMGGPGMGGMGGMYGGFGGMHRGFEQFGQPATFTDIAVGDIVIVKTASGNATLAEQINIIKIPDIEHIQGTITAVAADSITITPDGAAAVTLTWDANTRFILKGLISVETGQTATAVYNATSNVADIVLVRMPEASPAATPMPTASPSPAASPSLSPSPTLMPPVSPTVTP